MSLLSLVDDQMQIPRPSLTLFPINHKNSVMISPIKSENIHIRDHGWITPSNLSRKQNRSLALATWPCNVSQPAGREDSPKTVERCTTKRSRFQLLIKKAETWTYHCSCWLCFYNKGWFLASSIHPFCISLPDMFSDICITLQHKTTDISVQLITLLIWLISVI